MFFQDEAFHFFLSMRVFCDSLSIIISMCDNSRKDFFEFYKVSVWYFFFFFSFFSACLFCAALSVLLCACVWSKIMGVVVFTEHTQWVQSLFKVALKLLYPLWFHKNIFLNFSICDILWKFCEYLVTTLEKCKIWIWLS